MTTCLNFAAGHITFIRKSKQLRVGVSCLAVLGLITVYTTQYVTKCVPDHIIIIIITSVFQCMGGCLQPYLALCLAVRLWFNQPEHVLKPNANRVIIHHSHSLQFHSMITPLGVYSGFPSAGLWLQRCGCTRLTSSEEI